MVTSQHIIQQNTSRLIALVVIMLFYCSNAFAQKPPGSPLDLPNEQQKDSVQFEKSNTDEWHTDNVALKIRYKHLGSDKVHTVDSSIHTFHRKPYSQPWNMNLGNYGTISRSLMFTPEDRTGPTLGYNAMDIYRIEVDSIKYYNTTTPYSEFGFFLGSKLEQNLKILHTQNIKPNWNFAAEYGRISSEGFFLLQRTSHDRASFSTNYQSINRRYKLHAGITYNRTQQDENGGIVDITQLTDDNYNTRSNIDIAYADANANSSSSIPRSLVTNIVRDYNGLLQQSYSWGSRDSTYNEDSTKMTIEYTPRFGITHRFKLSNKEYTYKDKKPDSIRYAPVFANNFIGDGSSDSVFTRQKQNTIDNAIMLNGFFGKKDNQTEFSIGAGIRIDKFSTRFLHEAEFTTFTSNYIEGNLKKEALKAKAWFYNANARFYITGVASGNSVLHISAGRQFGDSIGSIDAGIQQNINNAPFSYTTYITNVDTIRNTFNQESITKAYISLRSERYNFSFNISNYLISNYFYVNSNQLPDQYAPTFNILQASLRKAFKWKGIVLDNEITYQQFSSGAPVNIPPIMLRHQLSYERGVFNNALKIATGVQMRYYSPYNTARYSPIFHRYYYSNNDFLVNDPVYAFFFNFRVKRFRSFIMVDHIQQAFTKQNFIATPGYPAQDIMMRFGFNWVLLK